MARTRCTLALLLGLAFATDASAQFVVGWPSGIGFRYKSGNLRIGGFIPTGGVAYGSAYYPYGPYYPAYPIAPYGVVQQRVNVQVLAPPVVIVRRPAGPDLSGIDLDVEPASKIWGEKPGGRKSELVGGAARVEPPPVKKAPPEPKPELPPMPPPAKPEPEPIPETVRVTGLGIDAFKDGEYNLAILHFRHLGELSPIIARPLFLEGQALLAVGKYHEAFEIITRGLKRHPEWPTSAFRPKADLYDNDVALWTTHRKQLEEAHLLHPKNAEYRFLLGYMAWFDGQRDTAIEHFLEARALTPDSPWSDLFLKAAKK